MSSDSVGARMFTVVGLPNINIPVPPREVLEAYKEDNCKPLEQYLQEYLTTPTGYGRYCVVVDVDALKEYVEVGDLVRVVMFVYTEKQPINNLLQEV